MRVPVLVALMGLAGERGIDEVLADVIQQVLGLGKLDQLTLAGSLPSTQRCHHRERSCNTTSGVHEIGRIECSGVQIDIAPQRRQATQCFHVGAEPDVVGIGTADPQRGHSRHNQSRVPPMQLVPAEAQRIQNFGRVVLDEHITFINEPEEGLTAQVGAEIKSGAALVPGVDDERTNTVPGSLPSLILGIDAPVLTKLLLVTGSGARNGTPRSRREQIRIVEPDHFGTEITEQRRAERASPNDRQVKHPYAGKRQGRWQRGLRDLAGRPSDRRISQDLVGVLAKKRGGEPLTPAVDHAELRSGCVEASDRWMLDRCPEVSLPEVIVGQDVRGRVQRGHGQPKCLGILHGLLFGSRERPHEQHFVHQLRNALVVHPIGSGNSGGQFIVLEHRHHSIDPVRSKDDLAVAICGRKDTNREATNLVPTFSLPQPAGEEIVHQQRHSAIDRCCLNLEAADINVSTVPRLLGHRQRRQRGSSRKAAALILHDVACQLQRLPVGHTCCVQRTGHGIGR